jgi:hypothetical protein
VLIEHQSKSERFFGFILDDLSQATDEDLESRGRVIALALWALRDARNAERFLRHLAAWAGQFQGLVLDPQTADAAFVILRYIAEVLGQEHLETLKTRILELAPATENTMLTIAQAYELKGLEKGLVKGREEGLEKGLEKGLERGREEGLRGLVELQLAQKFSPLPDEARARLQAASKDDLERFAGRILQAETLDEIFEG